MTTYFLVQSQMYSWMLDVVQPSSFLKRLDRYEIIQINISSILY